MKSLKIVVEGRSDIAILRRLLIPRESYGFGFYAGGGRLSVTTLGRNILVHEGGPLMIVIDADTLTPKTAAETCDSIRSALRSVSADGSFDVFAFVPELEVLFFEASKVLVQRFGMEKVNELVIERGHYRPKAVLEDILRSVGLSREDFYKALSDEDVEELRSGDQARRLIEAVDLLVSSALSDEMVHPSARGPR
jgi:hypothetical protein